MPLRSRGGRVGARETVRARWRLGEGMVERTLANLHNFYDYPVGYGGVFTGGMAKPGRWRTGIICLGAESYTEILCYPTLMNSSLVLQPSSFAIPLVGIVLVNPKAWDEVEVR